jgi:hypothetical protein
MAIFPKVLCRLSLHSLGLSTCKGRLIFRSKLFLTRNQISESEEIP